MTDYYSSIAAGYDELHGAEQDAKLQAFLKRVSIAPNAKLLDVGCGTGRSVLLLPHVEWHGLEPSQGLIDHAQPSVKQKILLGPGEQIPWPDAAFDVVLSLTALMNYDDPQQGVREMARIAKPDTVIMISFLRKSPKREQLDSVIRATLNVLDHWEFNQDVMYVCRRRQ